MNAAPRQNILEAVQASLARDEGLTDSQRAAIASAIRERFADYANRIVKPDGADRAVVMRMIAEGSFDNQSPERIADVAFAAFQAVGRGAPPDVVEGIALYGYRKQIPGDRIAVWANGFNDAARNGVPSDVGADLVRNAMEHDWADSTFNTLKWALVDGQKRQFDVRRYAAFMFQKMEQGGSRPGAITATAVSTFRQAKQRGEEVPIPDYHGVFTIGKEPPAPPPPPPPAEEGKSEPPQVSPDQQAALDEAKAKEEAAVRAAAEAAEAKRLAEEQERAAKEEAARAADDASRKKARADAKAAEKRRKKAERDRRRAEKAAEKAKKKHHSLAGAPAGETGDPGDRPQHFSDAKMAAVWPSLHAAAESYLGTPYVWGGETRKGIDCSGFTKNSYREGANVGIPRNSRQQWKTGQRVDFDKLQAGDLVFFDTMGNGVSHVGMVIDPRSNRFMHASSSHGVMEADLSQKWFRKRYLGARRVIQ